MMRYLCEMAQEQRQGKNWNKISTEEKKKKLIFFPFAKLHL